MSGINILDFFLWQFKPNEQKGSSLEEPFVLYSQVPFA
jgi:hypothetical protein